MATEVARCFSRLVTRCDRNRTNDLPNDYDQDLKFSFDSSQAIETDEAHRIATHLRVVVESSILRNVTRERGDLCWMFVGGVDESIALVDSWANASA